MPKVGIKASIDVTPQGVACPEGWVRVSRAEGNATAVNFDVEFYASEDAFDQGYLPLLIRSFTAPYETGNLVELLHNHLLTLNLDDAANPNPYSRVKCNLSTGELITRSDPEPPPEEQQPEQSPEGG